jgi:hypothetical protein
MFYNITGVEQICQILGFPSPDRSPLLKMKERATVGKNTSITSKDERNTETEQE